MGAVLRAPPSDRPERQRRLLFAGLAAGAAVVAGAAPLALPVGMPQLVVAAALLLAVVVAYLRAPSAGLVALWALWLLAPAIRRLLGLTGPYLSADPLALAPFVATAAVAAIELTRTRLPGRVRRLLLVAAGGYLIGAPVGFLTAPRSMVFALLAYGAALLAFALGYADPGASASRLSVARVLTALGLPLAGYAVYQYFAGLPEWDERWLESVDFITAGAPEAGRTRVFSTLNSPGTFAAVLGLALCAQLARRSLTPWGVAGAAAAFVALSLTYVRSAWIALMGAALVFVLLTRGRGAGRVAAAMVGGLLLVIGLGAASPASASRSTPGRRRTPTRWAPTRPGGRRPPTTPTSSTAPRRTARTPRRTSWRALRPRRRARASRSRRPRPPLRRGPRGARDRAA